MGLIHLVEEPFTVRVLGSIISFPFPLTWTCFFVWPFLTPLKLEDCLIAASMASSYGPWLSLFWCCLLSWRAINKLKQQKSRSWFTYWLSNWINPGATLVSLELWTFYLVVGLGNTDDSRSQGDGSEGKGGSWQLSSDLHGLAVVHVSQHTYKQTCAHQTNVIKNLERSSVDSTSWHMTN